MEIKLYKKKMKHEYMKWQRYESRNLFNPLNTELNPICHFLTLLGAHHILHISRIRVKNGLLR
jgi:hypothetical protein